MSRQIKHRKVGLAELCKYDEIGKIPSGNLHPIPRAQSQSVVGGGRGAGAENPPSCRCSNQISLNQGLHELQPQNITFFAFLHSKLELSLQMQKQT